MLNLQQVEPLALLFGGSLSVVSIWNTIQGEGPFVGYPAVFVRTAGCNLQCPACDTDYTSNRKILTLAEILDEIWRIRRFGLVVLTGGEPFRQNIAPLVRRLRDRGYIVQIETNGTLHQEDFPYDDVVLVCSPKTPNIHPKIHQHVYSLKYIVQAGKIDPEDGLPTSTLGLPWYPCRPWPGFRERGGRVYLQPMDDGFGGFDAASGVQKSHLQAALDSCMKYGYILSLQTHKILGLD